MTTFTDGPAAGTTLSLRRSPLFLRAVQNYFTKTWDALDLVFDKPKHTERIVAYRRVSFDGTVHLCMSRGRGGTYGLAKYAVIENQPDEAALRDTAKWQAWCQAQVVKENAATKESP